MTLATLIPVRLAASRFPNKPFAMIKGLPMFHFVYLQVINDYPNTYLAICDERIKNYCIKKKLNFIQTDQGHVSGTDRIGQAVKSLEQTKDFDKVINIQGDMPFINPDHIRMLSENLDKYLMTTLCCPFINNEEFKNPNKVKVQIKKNNKSYFCQNFFRNSLNTSKINYDIFHHIGVYGYTKQFLKDFIKIKQGEREKKEKLEQLRVLETAKIGISLLKENILGVDTEEDLIRVNQILNND